MKSLLFGIVFIIVVGLGGFVYRNAVEHPAQPIACPMDAKVCPDGTAVGRTGSSCTFPVCPAPNVALPAAALAFAVPSGFTPAALPDPASIAAYESTAASTTAMLVIRRYGVDASSTALAVIKQTAINGASGLPASVTAFSSTELGTHRFTVVTLERFEGVIDIAYYLARENDVLRFDAIDQGVAGWTDPALNTSTLPAQVALQKLLATLQGE